MVLKHHQPGQNEHAHVDHTKAHVPVESCPAQVLGARDDEAELRQAVVHDVEEEVPVVVEADAVSDEGAVVVKHEDALAGDSAVLGTEGLADVARVAEGGDFLGVGFAVGVCFLSQLFEGVIVDCERSSGERSEPC